MVASKIQKSAAAAAESKMLNSGSKKKLTRCEIVTKSEK